MIGQYTSKHPGLITYLILVSTSVLTFLFLDVKALEIGILSILWSSFILARALSFFEAGAKPELFDGVKGPSKNGKNSALPHDLTRRMNGKDQNKRSIFAMNALHERTILWLVLGIIYAAYTLSLSYEGYATSTLLQHTSVFFIIGAVFWAGQTYAYSNSASKLMLIVCCALFVLALFETTNSFNIQWHYEIARNFTYYYDNSSLPLLAALITYTIAILAYSCIHGSEYRNNALMGMATLFVLVLYGLALKPEPNMAAFWISGLSLFSVFWIRSYCHIYKRYTVYQCE